MKRKSNNILVKSLITDKTEKKPCKSSIVIIDSPELIIVNPKGGRRK